MSEHHPFLSEGTARGLRRLYVLTSCSFGALLERELPAESLSLRQVFRQRYLELSK